MQAENLIQFPSCDVKPRERLALTPSQRRAAVKLLAEKGVEGIDELLKDLERDEEFEKRVRHYKEEYMKERERRLKEFKERMRRELARLRRRREELEGEVRLLTFSGSEIGDLGIEDELIAALEGRYREEGENLSLLERIILFFKRIVMVIRSALAWLKRFLFGREKGGVRGEEVRVAVRSLKGRFDRLKRTLDERLFKDPMLQEEVDRKLVERWGIKGERIIKRKYDDREGYRRAAERVLKEILEEEMERSKGEGKRRKEKEKRIREEIKRVEMSEEAVKGRIRREEVDLKRAAEKWGKERVKRELLKNLERIGYVRRGGEGYEITESLVERFSELLYEEVSAEMGGIRRLRCGGEAVNLGIYEIGRLKSALEEPHLEILQSYIQSRMNHPGKRGIYDEDMLVLREEEVSLLHVVILFDSSGSMEERGRLKAAKRAALALYRAVKRDNPNNVVDFFAFATGVERVDLRGILSKKPHGFTNMERALRVALETLKEYPGERNLIYLITDGLPEAYDTETGPVAGDLKEALRRAVEVAREISHLKELKFHFFLLEPVDETYVIAAREITSAAGGTLVVTDPERLERQVVERYYF